MRFLLYDNYGTQTATITHAFSAHLSEAIGQYDALTVDFPRTPEYTSLFKQAFFVGIPIEEDEQYKLFKIDRPDFSDDAITITAVESASDDLAVQGYIDDRRFYPGTIKEGLDAIFGGSTWNYDLQAGNAAANFNFYKVNRKTALENLCNVFGLEVQFTYETSGNKISNKICHVYKQLGSDTSKRLIKGRNVTDFKLSKDQSQLFTAAIGKGAGVQEKDKNPSDDKKAGYSRSIDFSDVEWSKAKGDPVDKPKGQNYVELPEATAKYGWRDNDGELHPRLTICDFSSDDMPENLLIDTYNYLVQHSAPSVSVTAAVAKIGKTNLGDRMQAIDFEDNLRIEARATKINRDLLDDSQTVVTIGNYRILTPFQRQRKTLQRLAEKQAEDSNDKLLEEKINDNADAIKDLQDKDADYDKDLKDLKNSLKDNGDALKGLNDKMDDMQADMPDIDNMQQDMDNVKQQADNAKQQADSAANQAKSNSDAIKTQKASTDDLAKQIKANQAAISKLQGGGLDLSKITGVIRIITDTENTTKIDRVDLVPKGKEQRPLIDGTGNIAPNLTIPHVNATTESVFHDFTDYDNYLNFTHDLLHYNAKDNKLNEAVVSAHDVASIANDIIRNLADHGLPCTETEARINGPDSDPTNNIAMLAKDNRLITGGNWYDIIGVTVKQWIQKQIDDLDINGAENTLHGQIQQNSNKIYDLGQKIEDKYNDLSAQISELKMQYGK